jgi:2,3-dihydroxybenzoate decarboxylase
MGMERVLYAMDYPYQYAIEEVPMLDAMDLAPDDKLRFFQRNAEAVFKLL